MLEMTKTVLERVSFDRGLFKKELRKSFKWLKRDELLILKTWCLATFSAEYTGLINNAFNAM
jgi:hypothetical protein